MGRWSLTEDSELFHSSVRGRLQRLHVPRTLWKRSDPRTFASTSDNAIGGLRTGADLQAPLADAPAGAGERGERSVRVPQLLYLTQGSRS